MAAQDNNSAAAAVSGFFKSIGGFFADFGTAVVKGDAFVKLSLILCFLSFAFAGAWSNCKLYPVRRMKSNPVCFD